MPPALLAGLIAGLSILLRCSLESGVSWLDMINSKLGLLRVELSPGMEWVAFPATFVFEVGTFSTMGAFIGWMNALAGKSHNRGLWIAGGLTMGIQFTFNILPILILSRILAC